MDRKGKLLFLCGKMAAGKSTLSKALAEREDAVLLILDEFLDQLFPGEIVDIAAFVTYSSRIRNALAPHICSLLSRGMSVVLDFPGNTRNQRIWFRQLCHAGGCGTRVAFHRCIRRCVQAAAQGTQQRASPRHEMDNGRRIRRDHGVFRAPGTRRILQCRSSRTRLTSHDE